MYVLGACRGQRKASDSLELECILIICTSNSPKEPRLLPPIPSGIPSVSSSPTHIFPKLPFLINFICVCVCVCVCAYISLCAPYMYRYPQRLKGIRSSGTGTTGGMSCLMSLLGNRPETSAETVNIFTVFLELFLFCFVFKKKSFCV